MELTVHTKAPYRIVDVLGKVDRLKDAITLKSLLNSMFEEGVLKLGLNLSQVTYLDSGALNVFVYAATTLRNREGVFCLIEPNEYVMDVLEVVGLAKMITIFPSITDFERQI